MYPFPTLSHAQLMDLAHQCVEAAHDHDPDRVEADTLRLFEALIDHVLAERPVLLYLRPADALLLSTGQQHIADRLLDLAASAANNTDQCDCTPIAEELAAEIDLQADDERRHLLAAAD